MVQHNGLNLAFFKEYTAMKVTTPEISWHERDPIYSVDIQPGNRTVRRLVSGGVDKYVRVSLIKKYKRYSSSHSCVRAAIQVFHRTL